MTLYLVFRPLRLHQLYAFSALSQLCISALHQLCISLPQLCIALYQLCISVSQLCISLSQLCTSGALHSCYTLSIMQHFQRYCTVASSYQLFRAFSTLLHSCKPQPSGQSQHHSRQPEGTRCMYSGWGRYRDTSENYVFIHCGIDPASGLIRSIPLRHRGDLPAISSVDLAALCVTNWQRFFEGLPAVAARRARAAPSWQRLSNSLIVATARTIRVFVRWVRLSHGRITWAETLWWRIWPGQRPREGLAALPAIHW